MRIYRRVNKNVKKIIVAGLTMGYIIEYHLTDATLRKVIDIRYWKNDIISAVKAILPNVQQVRVFKNFYRITVSTLPTSYELQEIGRKISSNPTIGKNVREYEYLSYHGIERNSKQLFVRRKPI